MTKKISIRLEDDLDETIRCMADENNISFSEQTVILIEKGLVTKDEDLSKPVNTNGSSVPADYGDEVRYVLRLCLENLAISRELFEQQESTGEFDSFDEFYEDSYLEAHHVLNAFTLDRAKKRIELTRMCR